MHSVLGCMCQNKLISTSNEGVLMENQTDQNWILKYLKLERLALSWATDWYNGFIFDEKPQQT